MLSLVFWYFAIVGFVASLIANIIALIGYEPPLLSFIWALHCGVFVIYPVALFLSWRYVDYEPSIPQSWWKKVFASYSPRLRFAHYLIGGYAILLMLVVRAHKVTLGDFDEMRNLNNIIVFSSVWMVFYFNSAALLHKWRNEATNKLMQPTLNIPRFSRHESLTETEKANAKVHSAQEDPSVHG